MFYESFRNKISLSLLFFFWGLRCGGNINKDIERCVSLESSITLKMVEPDPPPPYLCAVKESTDGMFEHSSTACREEKHLPSLLKKGPGSLGEFNDELTSLKM